RPPRKSRISGPLGSSSSMRMGASGASGSVKVIDKQYTSLAGTERNCSGGPTPWGSWISCEESTVTPTTYPADDPRSVSMKHGYNFEVPITGEVVQAEPLVAMGRFNHEAVAVDPNTGIVYQTEDRMDGLFYRFIPKQPGNLKAGGLLEALKIQGTFQKITVENFPVGQPMAVEWVRIEDVDPEEDTVRVEGFGKGATQFTRGEGAWYGNNEVYFTCTSGGSLNPNTGWANGAGQVWRYVPGSNPQEGGTIELFVESHDRSLLEHPDNVTMSPSGDLILCEDGGGDQFLVGVNPKGELYQLARNALNSSEFAGACFSPNGRIMFVNIQEPGITFAIQGPWV
ncbi:MAG: DUF839 domain-containing protein, partial [Moorea sp. SIO2B7]|nr:DUF839 domain-containing protein [Moorena sp. SIO2B7]